MGYWNVGVAAFIAFAFTGWPIIGNYSRASGGWIGTVVLGATAIAVALLSMGQLSSFPMPNMRGMIWLIVAGIINGVAVYVYSIKIADVNMPIAVFVVTVSMLMVVMAPILNWILNNAIPSPNHFFGFGFALLAIYFMSK